MSQSYSPFPLTAPVSPETRLQQPGEVSGGASVTLHSPSGYPPVQAWKYILPSFAGSQTKQALWSCGQCGSTAGRLPVLLVLESKSSSRTYSRSTWTMRVSTHMGQKAKLASSTTRLSLSNVCSRRLTKNHQKQEDNEFQAPLLVHSHLLPEKGQFPMSVNEPGLEQTSWVTTARQESHCFGSLLLTDGCQGSAQQEHFLSTPFQTAAALPRKNLQDSLLPASKEVEQIKTCGSAPLRLPTQQSVPP